MSDPNRRDANTKSGPRTTKTRQKMPSRLDEPRSLRHPSAPPSSSGEQKMPSHLDASSKPMSKLDQTSTPSSSSRGHKVPSRLDASSKPMSKLDKTSIPSAAAPYLKSEYDRTMASRQTRIAFLPPKEREEQEAWVESHLATLPGNCPAGFKWKRVDGLKGYQCQPGNHLITDELIEEGKGGCKYNTSELPGDTKWWMLTWSEPRYPSEMWTWSEPKNISDSSPSRTNWDWPIVGLNQKDNWDWPTPGSNNVSRVKSWGWS